MNEAVEREIRRLRGDRTSRPPEAKQHIGVIVKVHDYGYAELVLLASPDLVFPRVKHMPGLHLEPGFKVAAWSTGQDLCITDVIGFVHGWESLSAPGGTEKP